ncbi:conserved hypothetical protein [Leishmania major strain Friedlin]|uniref:Uncharacterized protein n=1 Tax=Leishmania major TaxID=5664 RepID=Q4QIW4_LEIMA|nr:conserved hypothetical protein [Leishmania major strain Friedlin]CAG9568910.1 hypothetical_protein_-_conserved [Leishmania major strain Friedlin]CAJ02159.1 conserved hypothetical protein [Leishmania major strain Friedlin]|eukprot:XP_001680884.1 conserved hypothetical protein [Leishmania major strain Friedlin]
MSRVVVVMALALCLAIAAVPAVTTVQRGSCIFLTSPPSYTFIGGGFHMQLALEYPLPAKDVRLSFDLPKSFFIDEAEAEQLYRMEVLSADPMTQGTAAVVVADVTRAYSSLRMSSQYAFDIEAPVFKVNYTTNHVVLTFQQVGGDGAGSVLDAYLAEDGAQAQVPFRARLVIPIHSRYEVLDTKMPFSLLRFITGEGAYVRRCLTRVDVAGRGDPRCSAGTYRASAAVTTSEEKPHYKHCVDLPVGLLADLPYVYHVLMGLLVAGAALLILAIR